MSIRVGEHMEGVRWVAWKPHPSLISYSMHFSHLAVSELISSNQISRRGFQVFLKVNNTGKRVVGTPVSDRSVRRDTEAEEAVWSQVEPLSLLLGFDSKSKYACQDWIAGQPKECLQSTGELLVVENLAHNLVSEELVWIHEKNSSFSSPLSVGIVLGMGIINNRKSLWTIEERQVSQSFLGWVLGTRPESSGRTGST